MLGLLLPVYDALLMYLINFTSDSIGDFFDSTEPLSGRSFTIGFCEHQICWGSSFATKPVFSDKEPNGKESF